MTHLTSLKGAEKAQADSESAVVVALRTDPKIEDHFSRSQRIEVLREVASSAKKEFIEWLKTADPEIDLDRDIGPSGWREGMLPTVVIRNRTALIELLRQPEKRPSVVKAVSDVPTIRIPEDETL